MRGGRLRVSIPLSQISKKPDADNMTMDPALVEGIATLCI